MPITETLPVQPGNFSSLNDYLAEVARLDAQFGPSDAGFAGWSFDPACIGNNSALTNGTAYFSKVPIRIQTAITKIWFVVTTAAITPTAGQCFFGLYSIGATTATLLASGDAATVIASTGPQSVTITSQTLQPGYYLACLSINAGTPPNIGRTAGAPSYGNGALATANLRFFSNTTGNTTALPSSITLSSNSTANAGTQAYWAGLS